MTVTRKLVLAAAIAAGAAFPAAAIDLNPVVAFSVLDQPLDGNGDTFNSFTGLLRTQSTRADRAMLEYDISSLAGQTIASATITGTIANNNAGGTFPRTFEFGLYNANGVRDLSDYQIAQEVVGDASWPAPTPPLEFSFDVTAALQNLVNAGATHAGLKVTGTSANLFPSILSADTILSVETGGPACPVCAADFDQSGGVDGDDITAFFEAWQAGAACGDVDGSGGVDGDDIPFFFVRWEAGGCN